MEKRCLFSYHKITVMPLIMDFTLIYTYKRGDWTVQHYTCNTSFDCYGQCEIKTLHMYM